MRRPQSLQIFEPNIRRLRLKRRLALGLALALTPACNGDGDTVKKLLGRDTGPTRWERDSMLLASEPEVLFRVMPDPGGAYVVPIATVGSEGIRPLKLSARGWRRADANYMHAGKTLTLYRMGQSERAMRMFRGMWQPGAGALDSLNCPVVIPMARAIVPSETGRLAPPFATSGARPPLPARARLDAAEINRALANVGTLVAPTSGIAPVSLPRYTRQIHQIPTGINGSSTILIEYNDRAPLPDSLKAYGERPRQLIVMMDKGTYGYRPSLQLATVGSRGTPPKLEFLDYLDIDNDGIPELFFGLQERELAPLFTVVYRYENESWREVFRFTGNRCDF